MVSKKEFVDIISTFDEESANLQKKVLERCGYSDKTYVPHSIRMLPAKLLTFNNSRKEIEKVMFGAIDDPLSITRVNVREIGIVIVTCVQLWFDMAQYISNYAHHYK
ncbi:hypothetical protein RND71_001010 [Anisodus tanguticus]|uniref:FAE domain-containing protein n=1 Tax=Anisodus tanguticus TaxID=243964 RepID=A0AAE1VQJ2_9SOLA|nr:hypothetical protein RND71_001010 [Anisodus tanguticus]